MDGEIRDISREQVTALSTEKVVGSEAPSWQSYAQKAHMLENSYVVLPMWSQLEDALAKSKRWTRPDLLEVVPQCVPIHEVNLEHGSRIRVCWPTLDNCDKDAVVVDEEGKYYLQYDDPTTWEEGAADSLPAEMSSKWQSQAALNCRKKASILGNTVAEVTKIAIKDGHTVAPLQLESRACCSASDMSVVCIPTPAARSM